MATRQGTNLKAEIRHATAKLEGKALWRALRTLDMAKFDFGDRRTRIDSDGLAGEVGEFARHIQCPWRITREGKVIVGSSDLYYPANHQYDEDVPDEFDWERTTTLRDQLLDVLFDLWFSLLNGMISSVLIANLTLPFLAAGGSTAK